MEIKLWWLRGMLCTHLLCPGGRVVPQDAFALHLVPAPLDDFAREALREGPLDHHEPAGEAAAGENPKFRVAGE